MALARQLREGFLRKMILELHLSNSAKKGRISVRGMGVGSGASTREPRMEEVG